jgi:NAD(P)-dependent dehydrogenase (short-subunit alcohol dehydrogenase family)
VSPLRGAVLVTGGGAGIGRATVLACARLAAKVAVLDLDAGAADKVAAEALDAGAPAAIGQRCDVRDEASISSAVSASCEALGQLWGAVTSAGIDRAGLVHELALEQWDDVVSTNLTGTFLTCKHALAAMMAHGIGGSVVCVSSPWAQFSAPGGASAYCAAKGGVSALVRSLALDYAPHDIRVNAIVPGATETALMWASVPEADLPAMRARVASQLAMGRLAAPAEIAEGIIWLLGDASSYVTGSHLVVDGGLMARGSIDA